MARIFHGFDIDALPHSLMDAMAAGIGLLIAIVGLQWSGLIVPHPGTIVGLGNLNQPAALTALFGLGVISVLWIRGVTGAILLGMIAYSGLSLFTGKARNVAWAIHVCALFFMLRYIFLV
jgi:AGZA family xanthine/uracil permease-like MFS transporter